MSSTVTSTDRYRAEFENLEQGGDGAPAWLAAWQVLPHRGPTKDSEIDFRAVGTPAADCAPMADCEATAGVSADVPPSNCFNNDRNS